MYVRQSDYHYTDRDKLYYVLTQCNNTRAVPNPLMQEANDINCKCSSCPVHFFLFSLIQHSVSVLFLIISCLFNFTCTLLLLFFYSEALLWFCYHSKFVERVSLWEVFPWASAIRQCVSPAVVSLLSKVPWLAFVRGISYFKFDKLLDTNVRMNGIVPTMFTFFKLNSIFHDVYTFVSNTHGIIFLSLDTQKSVIHFLCYFSQVDTLCFSQY